MRNYAKLWEGYYREDEDCLLAEDNCYVVGYDIRIRHIRELGYPYIKILTRKIYR